MKNQYSVDLFNSFVARLRSANAHLFDERSAEGHDYKTSIMAVFNFNNINNVLRIHEVNHDLLLIAYQTGVYLLIVIEQQTN